MDKPKAVNVNTSPLNLGARPGERPSDQLRRVRKDNPEIAHRLNYSPHIGNKQRLKGLKRLAKQQGTELIPCSRCGIMSLLDSLQDAADGKLCCMPCLNKEMLEP